jgi:hypothetical protein
MNRSEIDQRRTPTMKLAILGVLCASLLVALSVHATHLNGPWYWKWPWQRMAPGRYWPAMLAAAMPLAGAMVVWSRWRGRAIGRAAAVALLMLYVLATQIVYVGLQQTPFGFRRMAYIVVSPMNTSYFWDAATLDGNGFAIADVLHDYPQLMPKLQLHSQEKPPGPVLFFWLILRLTSPDNAATVAGFAIAALATLTVPATYTLARVVMRDGSDARDRNEPAFLAAVVMSLFPGFVLHCPMLDQIYPVVSCLLIITWLNALERATMRWAAAYGLTLAVACFIVYQFLVLGAFLASYSLYFVLRDPAFRSSRGRLVARQMLVAAAVLLAFYIALFTATGFDPIATFRTALANQAHLTHDLPRRYPVTIWFDLQDFALGCGWLSVALVVFYLSRQGAEAKTFVWLCAGQIVLLAVTGLIQAETARTWCFLMPLVALPAGLELARWPMRSRVAVVVMMWLILAVVGQNLKFIFEPSEGGNPRSVAQR